MAGKIIIDTEKCKGCGLCVSVCPKGTIAVCEKSNSKGYYPPRPVNGDCTGCCKCAVVCPDAAIEVQRDSERIKTAEHHRKGTTVSLVEGRV
ncbi:MAG: 4Fe-4S dicluster domain-containing protein [Planctomycetota bacterium]